MSETFKTITVWLIMVATVVGFYQYARPVNDNGYIRYIDRMILHETNRIGYCVGYRDGILLVSFQDGTSAEWPSEEIVAIFSKGDYKNFSLD